MQSVYIIVATKTIWDRAMHREFLKLLEKATGRSEYVIAVNLDIRSFTPFCQTVDSVDVATYIRKVYSKIIEDHFKNASYYKPTGDGLILTIPYTSEDLSDVAESAIDSCLSLLENFGSLCIGDHMITYPTPQKIGIGLTRGSVCCIHSGDKTLDYSGRILNLASRLMDLARPSGIVFDHSFGIDLLSKETKELFSEEMVYVRGVAEQDPIGVYYTKKYTLIPDSYRKPLKEPKWDTTSYEFTLGELKKVPGRLSLPLNRKPLDESRLIVKIVYADPGLEGWTTRHDWTDEFNFHDEGGNKYAVKLPKKSIPKLVQLLESRGITGNMNIRFDIVYPIK